MLDKEHPGLSLKRQCTLLGINRSSVYYKAQPIRTEDLELMKFIDDQYMRTPVYGSRSMLDYLNNKGYPVGRKRVQRLMRLMGVEAIYPKPRTSKPHPGHRIYPYLLKGLDINRPNMVWAADITYVPLRREFMYLVAVMDWYSGKVLSWRISRIPSIPIFAYPPWRRRSPAMVVLRYSIQTRAASSRVRHLQVF